jgi:hypothetical protein
VAKTSKFCSIPRQGEAIMAHDIGEWLEGLGLGKYAEIFVENDMMQTDEKRCKLTKRYI